MNCKRYKAWMSEAATDRLPARQRTEFETHVQECAGCREEFARIRALLKTIDRRVIARAAAEPSPEFVTRVRRKIAADRAPAQANWLWWAAVTAGVAAIVIAAGLWMMRPQNIEPRRVATNSAATNQPVVVNHPAPNPVPAVSNPAGPRRNPDSVSVRRVAMTKRPRIESEPEVLVPPGQAKAVLLFAALVQNGKLDGTKLLGEQQKADQLIEIKPLVIAPLENSAQADNAGSGPGSSGTEKDFVSDEAVRMPVP